MATNDTHGQEGTPWVGFDLDGNLAEYFDWEGYDHIGKPIPKMVALIKAYRAKGMKVKIFTARVAPTSADPNKKGGGTHEAVMKVIADWCEKNLGFVPEVTHEKDFLMLECFDDRATQTIPNTGVTLESQSKMMKEAIVAALAEIEPLAKGRDAMAIRLNKPYRTLKDALDKCLF